MMERMVFFLKPDAVLRRSVGVEVIKNVMSYLGDANLEFFGELTPHREFLANKHYKQHKGKNFYNWLIEYVTCTPLVVLLVKGVNIIDKLRNILGPTIPEEAPNETIRGKYGIGGGINVAHASDSVYAGAKEWFLWKTYILSNYRKENNWMDEVEKYISRYNAFNMVDIGEYREIYKLVNEGKIDIEKATKRCVYLLSTESDFNDEVINRFATVCVNNFLMKR